uniref:uncharacterized protein n=1 Tax=Myxine glutinosa TaxID=7769 RepID=UPI00358F56FA
MAGNKMLVVSQLCADPQAPDAGLQLTHWLKTLENRFADQDTVPTAAAKLAALQSKVDYKVYNSIARCATYDLAVAELKRLYIKQKSVIYARHLLRSRRQQPNEPVDHYAQELRQLLLDRTQEPRTHEQVQDVLLLDAFVSGVSSQDLRLKLLEKTDLTFTAALEQGKIYTEARLQSNDYDRMRLLAGTSLHARPESATADETGADPLAELQVAPAEDPGILTAAATVRPKASRGAACYFCGGQRHHRTMWPARDAICHLCSQKGHYAKVGRTTARGSRPRATLNGLIAEPTGRARNTAPYPALMGSVPPRGPLVAQSTLARDTEQPQQSHPQSDTERASLTGLRATRGPLEPRPTPAVRTRYVSQEHTASSGGDTRLVQTTEAHTHQTAIMNGKTTEAHTCQTAILNGKTAECMGRLTDSFNECPMNNEYSGNDRNTADCMGTLPDNLYEPPRAPSDARKTAAGIGPTREARPTHSGGSVPLPAGSSGLAQVVIPLMVEGHCVRALVDTGSTDSFIDQRLVHRHGWQVLGTTRRIFIASQGLWLNTKGECRLKLVIKGRVFPDVHLMVLPALCADILLGHDFLKRHGRLEMEFGGPDTLAVGGTDTLAVCALAKMEIQPLSLFPNLTSDCTPVAVKSRRYSRADMQFIAGETAQLLKDGIIEPSRSPWRAQVLVVRSEAHRRCMVIDYSQTINRFTQLDAYPLPGMDALVRQVAQYSVYSTLDLRSVYHQIPISRADRIYTAFESGQRLYQFTRLPFGVTNGVPCFQRAMDDLIARENLTDVFVYLDNLTVCGYDQGHHDTNLKHFLEVAQRYRLTMNEAKCQYSLRKINLLGYTVTHGSVAPDKERLRPLLDMAPPSDRASLKRALGLFAHYFKWVQNLSAKFRPLVTCDTFPLCPSALAAFGGLKADIASAAVATIDESGSFVLESDASDHAIAATLSQGGRPMAFFSWTLTSAERRHSSVEKEVYAIVESIRRWRPYLLGRCFQIITDQQSVAFMYDTLHAQRIKNEKITRWRIELADFCYTIKYRPGKDNQVADALSRPVTCAGIITLEGLRILHATAGHPGVTHFAHFVRSGNLPYSIDDIRRICRDCAICAEIKPRFYNPPMGTLVRATRPWERLVMDFKGPLPVSSNSHYLLTIVDEYSRFPFAYTCVDMTAATVMRCLQNLFSMFGYPAYVHTDRGVVILSQEVRGYLLQNNVASSYTTPYRPQANGQIERFNRIIWRAVVLNLRTLGWGLDKWAWSLPAALNSIRALLCTATNQTPHERLFHHPRSSGCIRSLPSWLAEPGPAYLKWAVRTSKYDPLVDKVQVLQANPEHARVMTADGRESTVSVRHLAPCGVTDPYKESDGPIYETMDSSDTSVTERLPTLPSPQPPLPDGLAVPPSSPDSGSYSDAGVPGLRGAVPGEFRTRAGREIRRPDRYGWAD